MPIPFEITREDLLRSKTVTPGWYILFVKEVEETTAKTDGSALVKLNLVVTQGQFKDVSIPHNFSEKAPGFAVSYIEACSKKKISEDGGRFDMAATKGKSVWGYVKNDMYQGRLTNKIETFLPYTEGESVPPSPTKGK